MTPAEAATALRALAALLTVAGATRPTPALGGLAAALEAAGGATLAAAVKKLRAVPEQLGDGPPLGTIEPLLPPLRTLLAAAGKAAGAKDAGSLAALVAAHAGSDAEALARAAAAPAGAARRTAAKAPVRDDLVEAHERALEAQLASGDGFAAAFAGLEADAAMGKAEMLALARRFAGGAARSRADALQRIWSRHAAVLSAQAKAKATGGRSAA